MVDKCSPLFDSGNVAKVAIVTTALIADLSERLAEYTQNAANTAKAAHAKTLLPPRHCDHKFLHILHFHCAVL